MNALKLWNLDVAWAGQPVTSKRGNSCAFDFFRDGNHVCIWYVWNNNILCRLPMDMDEKEYHWILTSKQVTAFYRDWNILNRRNK